MSSNISEKSLINPYELLGVNINSCLKEVRKSYYNFAKICHPDKGGDKKDMYIVAGKLGRGINAQGMMMNAVTFLEDMYYKNLNDL